MFGNQLKGIFDSTSVGGSASNPGYNYFQFTSNVKVTNGAPDNTGLFTGAGGVDFSIGQYNN